MHQVLLGLTRDADVERSSSLSRESFVEPVATLVGPLASRRQRNVGTVRQRACPVFAVADAKGKPWAVTGHQRRPTGPQSRSRARSRARQLPAAAQVSGQAAGPLHPVHRLPLGTGHGPRGAPPQADTAAGAIGQNLGTYDELLRVRIGHGMLRGMLLDLTPDELLATTRSVRKRLDLTRPVEREVLQECMRLAQQAPTASYAQNWHFLVVTDAERRAALGELWRRV